jgi:hypothetical protein
MTASCLTIRLTVQQLEAKLVKLINAAPVMLFMKGTADEPQCGRSWSVGLCANGSWLPGFDAATRMPLLVLSR